VKTDISGNLAAGKPTKMSSDVKNSQMFSWRAADGRRDNSAGDKCCAYTAKQKGNWWEVDLQAVYLIREVDITSTGSNGELGCIVDLVVLDSLVTCRYIL